MNVDRTLRGGAKRGHFNSLSGLRRLGNTGLPRFSKYLNELRMSPFRVHELRMSPFRVQVLKTFSQPYWRFAMSRLISAAGCFARRVLFLLCFGCVMSGAIAIGVLGAEIGRHTDAVLDRGAELFAREWLPGDPRSHGGDGLGPVYNETSCIACHHQGGVGGAGPVSTNVDILTAGTAATPVDLHPGFRISRSVLLHRFAVDPEYQAWRLRLLDKGSLIAMLGAVDTEIQL